MSEPLRVVIGEDDVLLREGIARLLTEAGFDVVAQAGDAKEGVGYLLKERVGDLESFIDAVTRVARGGSALDPEVVGRMLGRRQRDRPLDRLSPRERDVLAAMAEGKSNHGIAQTLVVSQAAVEKHVTSIFHKLKLDPAQTEHRRVLAVLAYLRDPPNG